MTVCLTCLGIAFILLVGLLVYNICMLAGRSDKQMEEYEQHECHYVKHYDPKKKRYVYRCPVCGATNEWKEWKEW